VSDFKAIAAVTAKLVDTIKQTGLVVTARPLDKARDNVSGNQLNVFLYQAAINANWRNQDLPRSNGRAQPGRPLLPLNLYYLITAYGSEGASPHVSDVFAHQFLGRAMLTLHDKLEFVNFPPDSGIKNQTDPIRVTLQSLNLDEMSKLWSAFQTAYRPSVAYEVGAVLIESDLPSDSPLPVLRRGEEDHGWDSTTLMPPELTSIRFATENQPGAKLGETISIVGRNLNQAGTIQVAFDHPRVASPLIRTPSQVSEREVVVDVGANGDVWPAGIYRVTLQNTLGTGPGEHTYSSNAIPMALLPEVLVPPAGLAATLSGGTRFLSVPCRPKVKQGQRLQLLIGSVPFNLVDVSNPALAKVSWKVSEVIFPPSETRFVRLRIDGVDSLIYDPTNPQQGFDPKYIVSFP
jgi:hypothetical protein